MVKSFLNRILNHAAGWQYARDTATVQALARLMALAPAVVGSLDPQHQGDIQGPEIQALATAAASALTVGLQLQGHLALMDGGSGGCEDAAFLGAVAQYLGFCKNLPNTKYVWRAHACGIVGCVR